MVTGTEAFLLLPYVNTGIIFYLWQALITARSSNLPLTLVKYKQCQNVNRVYIDDLIAKWKVQWANRYKMNEEERTGVRATYGRTASMYYDETQVYQENGLEKVRMYENKVEWHSNFTWSHGPTEVGRTKT